MRRPSSLLTAAALLLGACDDGVTAPTVLARVVVGNIDAVGPEQVLETPETAIAGEPFTVTVTTFGNSCIEAAGAAVTVRDMEATVTPYDHEQLVGGCLDFRKLNPRAVRVVFAGPGEATIRVCGRSRQQSGFISVERRLTVGPSS